MARGKYKTYSPEWKSRAIELCLHAIKLGWSVARFCRWAGVSRVTMLDWLSDDTNFDRYRRAMETKALDIPALHMSVIDRVISGKIEPAVAGVALRSLEFRMMREIKRMYEPTQKVEHKHSIASWTDAEIDAEYERLQQAAAISAQLSLAPPRKET